ncbi:deoxyribose-phosphate aldolase [Pochonia chlamydosporia 170]|uniref:deoxyribose-phosphate aldolase n=1 Tax=Pochonia chlamydosporia 170 TaxID=1380566 RepID=A0A179FMU5_METCM|nr:deoxyribose-phosphate aldolase [Pochonia chlamydosporia 170]OAQ66393.1 deoxyribose-phosphate aldolase [Pochonia chlamydosporia 170]
MSQPVKVKVSLPILASHIDHSLLHPTLTDAQITNGLHLSKKYSVASACVKPSSVPLAAKILASSPVKVCSVVGFPHGSSSSATKIAETIEALDAGATEIDMVVNIGKVLGGEWHYVEHEVNAINRIVTTRGGLLKVIFENDYLEEEHIRKLCEICTELGVGFVKTSTGYGFVKQENGMYSYKGATVPHLKLMRESAGPDVQIKAAGGVRTLDDFLYVMSLGVTRVGASATEAIMEEARSRGIGDEEIEVEVKQIDGTSGGSY